MPIFEIVDPAEDLNLVDLDYVKRQLNILHSDTTHDCLLNDLIAAASAHIVTITGRSFAKERVKETVRGNGSNEILLTRRPVNTIHAITLDNDPVVDFDTTKSDLDSGILWRSNRWDWQPSRWWHLTDTPYVGSEEPNYVVEYTAGYTLPGYADPEDPPVLPADVKQYAAGLITTSFRREHSSGAGAIRRVNLLNEIEIEFADSTNEEKDRTISFVNMWRSVV